MTRRLTHLRQRGLSLIELMIAMTISLLVIGAVSGVYLTSSRNYTQDEMLSRMQENARYAFHVLAKDLTMAGYWGPILSSDDINTVPRSCTSSSTTTECLGLSQQSALSISTDCTPGTVGLVSDWAVSLAIPLELSSEVSSGSAANTSFNCIDATEFETGSDILVVKRVEGAELASGRDDSDDTGDIFIRTDGTEAMLFRYTPALDVSEGAGISDWRYRSNIYYIRNHFTDPGDGVPTLVREKLIGNSIQTEPGGVARAIEYFHVMLGIDTDSDAIANFYTSSPAVAQLNNVVTARIYVLARSAAPDPNYVNDKTYNLGDVTRDFSGSPDNFYRRVFTATVSLRNQRNRINTASGT